MDPEFAVSSVTLHTCEVRDTCGDTATLYSRSLRELLGAVGPMCPIVLDGRRGVLVGALDVGVSFLDAGDAPPAVERMILRALPN